jgi:hypothetical protein
LFCYERCVPYGLAIMSTQTSMPFASVVPGHPLADPAGAFERARQVLRERNPLGAEQFGELDELFRQVTHAQFIELTEDPEHQHQLRAYQALSRRLGLRALVPLGLGLALLFGVLAVLLAR